MIRPSILLMSLPCALAWAAPPEVIQPTASGTVVERRLWPLDAQGALKLRTDVGRVQVTGWDRAEAELTATFKSDRPDAHVRLEAQCDGRTLSLSSQFPSKKGRSWFEFTKHNCSCALDLKVPRACMAWISTDVGSIDLRGLKGWLEVHSDVGSITVTELQGHDRGMKLRTDVGKMLVELRDAKGRLEASTDVGSIHCELPGFAPSRQESHHLEGVLNGGQAPISLQTDVGSITLR